MHRTAFPILLVFAFLLTPSQTFATFQNPPTAPTSTRVANRPNFWIGYTEGRHDLPSGQFANWCTQRACLVHADGSERQTVADALVDSPFSWPQFAGWAPSGDQAFVLRLSETPENAAWEREHKTFRMTEGWLTDACVLDLHSHAITNLTAIDRVSNYNTGLFALPNSQGYGFTPLIDGISKPYLMDLDGHHKRDVSQHGTGFTYGYSISPNGQWISYHENYQVYVAKADGSEKRHIDTAQPFNFAPQWSPNSEWLLFVSGEHYDCHPTIVHPDGSQLRKLADRQGYRGVVERLVHPDFHSESSDVPVWAPDGRSIYYTAQVDSRIELFQVTLDGTITQLTHSRPHVRHYHPTPSPDGRWLLFGSDRDGSMQLYVAHQDGSDPQAITHVPPGYCAMHGHWQPQPLAPPPPTSTPTIVEVAKSTPEYTRKSEGDVIELDDGRLLLVYMEFSGTGSDFATTRLVAQESSDQGHSWHHHRVITETSPGDLNVYSPNLIHAQDGSPLLLFMRQHTPGKRTLHAWKSNDQGQTFDPYAEFFPNQDFSLCNATIKRLDSGRLLLPASPPAPNASAERGPYVATTLYSDDDARTWHASPSRITLPLRGAMEPHVQQTADGRVLMVMRNQLGKLYLAESLDEGATWSQPWASPLSSPESCPELTRIPGSPDLLMIWNPNFDPTFRSHFGKRSPLVASISHDQGRSWQPPHTLEGDPNRAYSNPGCRFTRNGQAIIHYWTCQYLPDWRMQDVIDLRVAITPTAWFYSPPQPPSLQPDPQPKP